jgi:hypothetical protein
MRKIDPAGVRDDFLEAIDELRDALAIVLRDVDEGQTQKMVAEAVLLNAVVLWEGFVSDLFVAYLNRDASRYQKQILSEWNRARLFAVTAKKHPKADAVRQALDWEGRNLTFKSADEMADKAKVWLSANHAAGFKKLTKQRKGVIGAASAMRNYLAHRSSGSRKRLQDALADAALPTHLRRQYNAVYDLGKWLLAIPPGKRRRRVESVVRRLKALARVLAP